ncbi:hypothetical protein GQX74_006552 [Glossina fuscipes]|nr:hypothetical protein GQX74_006552 [Glossina fuscipes]
MSTAQEDMSGQRRNSVQKTEILDETMEEIPIKEIVQDTIDENGDEVEEVTQVTRKVVKRTMKITEVLKLEPHYSRQVDRVITAADELQSSGNEDNFLTNPTEDFDLEKAIVHKCSHFSTLPLVE